jgi:hypothetical protein
MAGGCRWVLMVMGVGVCDVGWRFVWCWMEVRVKDGGCMYVGW